MKLFWCFLLLLSSTMCIAQRWNFGVGVEVNRSDLKFDVPNDGVYPYKILFDPSVGVAGKLYLEYNLTHYLNIYLSPSIGSLGMSVDDGIKRSRLNMNYYDIGMGFRLHHSGLTVGFGMGQSNFFDLYYSQRGNHRDLNKYILNKTILNASWFAGFDIAENIGIYVKGCYYFSDFFATESIDNLGRPVEVLLVRPQYLALGINYTLTQKKNN